VTEFEMLLLLAFMSLASDLSTDTAADLKVAWTYQTNATPPNPQAAKIAAFEEP
jgi:hypothetical protein